MTERSYTTEHTYQDAVQGLKTHLGSQWQGTEAEGRDEMLQILTNVLGFNRSEANRCARRDDRLGEHPLPSHRQYR